MKGCKDDMANFSLSVPRARDEKKQIPLGTTVANSAFIWKSKDENVASLIAAHSWKYLKSPNRIKID
jgi:hypothetical protein